MRRTLILAALVATACGDTTLPPFGQLRQPDALAFQPATGLLFIASAGGDELRVFDASERQFLRGPATVFPLSVPTVRRPSALAAGARWLFTLSSVDAELGFVDGVIAEGALGPRSLDGADGFPIALPLPGLPTALAALDGSIDHALVAGVDGAEGALWVVRAPVDEALPSLIASAAIPGVPGAIAIEASAGPLLGPDGAPIVDCRTVAVAEQVGAAGQPPAIHFFTLRLDPSGVATLEASPLGSLQLAIDEPRGAGVARRAAGVRRLAFAPTPEAPGRGAAIAAEPCEVRAGRLFVLLDGADCPGADSCADLTAIDLPSGAPARDPSSGGPALYDLPGAALELVALAGPIELPGAFDPSGDTRLGRVGSLVVAASSDGNLYYVDGGFGTPLIAPGVRGPSDRMLLADAEAGGPLVSGLTRLDSQAAGAEEGAPVLETPIGAQPYDERIVATFEGALPGRTDLGLVGDLAFAGGRATIAAPEGAPFHEGMRVQPGDRVAAAAPELACEGFVVESVAADGGSLVVLEATQAAPCTAPELTLQLLPPAATPWVLTGSVSGFMGLLADDGSLQELRGDGALLFTFRRGAVPLPRGASFAWITSDGFRLYGTNPGVAAQLPTGLAAALASPPAALVAPRWQLFVSYGGADAVIELDPELTSQADVLLYQ